jgi:hypothetical protein
MSRDSSVGIATRYGLDGPGIESQWSDIFRTLPDRPWGLSNLQNKVYLAFPRIKWSERGVDHPSTTRAEVKQRVEVYVYSPSGNRGL